MADDNPFDAPLPSEGGKAPAATPPSNNGNPFDEPLASEKQQQQPQQSPQVTTGRDRFGNQVKVSKDDSVLGGLAIPATAAGIAMAPAAAGELSDIAIKHLAGNVLPGMKETEAAKQTIMKAIPTVKQLIKLGIGYEGLKHLVSSLGGQK